MDMVQEKVRRKTDTLKVLIADDDAPTRILLRAAISQWGYEIIEAKDGEEAWALMQQDNAPQLLILDWLMPKLDGISICKLSKQKLSNPPYIILLTQISGATNITRGLDAGADEFLSKPFNMAELRSRLSVGARIMRNEKTALTNELQIKQEITQLEQYALDALTMVKKLDESNQSDHQAIVELQQHLTQMLTLLQQTKDNIKTRE